MSKLSDRCDEIYAEHGQYAVYEYVRQNYPKTPWAWCPPCECESPMDIDAACLVCGSPTEPLPGSIDA